MWFERFVIIVTSLIATYAQFVGYFRPTWIDILKFTAPLDCFNAIFAVRRFLPMIAMSEVEGCWRWRSTHLPKETVGHHKWHRHRK